MKTIDFNLYSHWAPALIYGDYSGLESEECIEIDTWISDMLDCYEMFDCIGCSSEETSEFGVPDIGGLAGGLSTFTFQVEV